MNSLEDRCILCGEYKRNHYKPIDDMAFVCLVESKFKPEDWDLIRPNLTPSEEMEDYQMRLSNFTKK